MEEHTTIVQVRISAIEEAILKVKTVLMIIPIEDHQAMVQPQTEAITTITPTAVHQEATLLAHLAQ